MGSPLKGHAMKKQFAPHDLWRFSYLSWPQVSEDGHFAALVIRKPDPQGVCQPSVRVIDAASGETVYETPAGRHESQPRFLPDGTLTLLSDESGEYQVWTVKEGRRTQKTFLRHGVSHYAAAGGVIAFEAVLWPEEIAAGTAFAEMAPAEKEAWQAELALRPYVAEDLTYKTDEWFGMRKGERPVVGLYRGDEAFLLMPDGTESVYPALSADGCRAAFYAYPGKGTHGRDARLTLWREGDKQGTPVSSEVRFPANQAPVFSPDGNSLWAPAYETFDGGMSQALARFDLLDGGKVTFFPDLAEETNVGGVNEYVISRTENGENDSCFAVLRDRVVFMTGWQGRTGLYSAAPNGDVKAEPVPLSCPDMTGFAMNGRGDLAVLSGSGRAPADLYLNGKRLTDEHAWLREYELPETEE